MVWGSDMTWIIDFKQIEINLKDIIKRNSLQSGDKTRVLHLINTMSDTLREELIDKKLDEYYMWRIKIK